MIKHYIEVKRTARYFLSKPIDAHIKQVVLVLHGYNQNANDFLESLSSLASNETLLLAPEALSKFYWKDFSTNPGSSWMTSIEREHEIKDIMAYLSQVCTSVLNEIPNKDVQLHILGFSQGVASASRFAAFSKLPFQNFFLYGGAPAHDLAWEQISPNMCFHLVYGDDDLFIKENQVQEASMSIQNLGFEVKSFCYEGKHKIEAAALRYIQKALED